MDLFSLSEFNDEGFGIDNKKVKGGALYKKSVSKKPLSKKTSKKISKDKPKKQNNKTVIINNESSESESESSDSESSKDEHNENNIVENEEKSVNLNKKQEEYKITEILSNPISELTQDELKDKINEYYNNYVKYVDIINEYYPKIRIPFNVKEETNIELKLLHILNELRKISSLLNTPLVLTDYNKTVEIKERNKELFTRKPILDKSVYFQTISNISLLNLEDIKNLINKYNYSDLFKVLKFKFTKTIIVIEPNNELFCKRYWINNMEQYKNLVYDKSVYYKKINKNTGINPVYLDLTNTIIYKNEEKIHEELKRYVNNINTVIDNKTLIDKIDNNTLSINNENSTTNKVKINQININKQQQDDSCFISSYNKYIEDKIKFKMVKCNTVPVKTMINISEQLINSININNLMNKANQNSELIDIVLSDIRIFLVDVLYNMNSSIKNKRELYFANAKIIFDITKNIKSNLKTELFSQDIKFPLDTFEKKTEVYGKLKNVLTKVINESGVKTIGRSVDQTICI
jgi:hypothetical protein